MDFEFIYKICTEAELLEAKSNGKFYGSKKDVEDGYIHFSDKEQLKTTLKNFFLNKKNLILLKVKTLELKNLVYEQVSDGNMFPHLYSKLDMRHVSAEYKIITNEDGSHLLPKNF